MRKAIVCLTLLFLVSPAFSLSNEDLRTIIDKPQATTGDAVAMLAALDDPEATLASVDLAGYGKLAGMDVNAALTVGDYAFIALEMGKAPKSLFFLITGLKRYAVDAMQARGFIPSRFAGNRALSGVELIELTRLLGARQNNNE